MMARSPSRAISAPVKKLGAYMPITCHWLPSAASPTEWLHITLWAAKNAEDCGSFSFDNTAETLVTLTFFHHS
ncbi:MAG: hypothetical protein WA858_12320 [Xanthobacteraceae bacterium]